MGVYAADDVSGVGLTVCFCDDADTRFMSAGEPKRYFTQNILRSCERPFRVKT